MIIYQLYQAPIEVLQEYDSVLANKIGDKGGIYILHHGKKIYYVGKATKLRQRIKQHFSDKHRNNWDAFSLYVVNDNRFLDSLERLLVTLLKPSGNSTLFKNEMRYKKELAKEIQQLQKQHLKELFPDVLSPTKTITRTYKGKQYKAVIKKNGSIVYNGKTYPSLTAVTKKITGSKNISGPYFWKINK